MVFRVGDETKTVERGGIWRIASDVPHTVTGGAEGAIVVDVFSPAGEDWRSNYWNHGLPLAAKHVAPNAAAA